MEQTRRESAECQSAGVPGHWLPIGTARALRTLFDQQLRSDGGSDAPLVALAKSYALGPRCGSKIQQVSAGETWLSQVMRALHPQGTMTCFLSGAPLTQPSGVTDLRRVVWEELGQCLVIGEDLDDSDESNSDDESNHRATSFHSSQLNRAWNRRDTECLGTINEYRVVRPWWKLHEKRTTSKTPMQAFGIPCHSVE